MSNYKEIYIEGPLHGREAPHKNTDAYEFEHVCKVPFKLSNTPMEADCYTAVYRRHKIFFHNGVEIKVWAPIELSADRVYMAFVEWLLFPLSKGK